MAFGIMVLMKFFQNEEQTALLHSGENLRKHFHINQPAYGMMIMAQLVITEQKKDICISLMSLLQWALIYTNTQGQRWMKMQSS